MEEVYVMSDNLLRLLDPSMTSKENSSSPDMILSILFRQPSNIKHIIQQTPLVPMYFMACSVYAQAVDRNLYAAVSSNASPAKCTDL